jgi:hypothetical protein
MLTKLSYALRLTLNPFFSLCRTPVWLLAIRFLEGEMPALGLASRRDVLPKKRALREIQPDSGNQSGPCLKTSSRARPFPSSRFGKRSAPTDWDWHHVFDYRFWRFRQPGQDLNGHRAAVTMVRQSCHHLDEGAHDLKPESGSTLPHKRRCCLCTCT